MALVYECIIFGWKIFGKFGYYTIYYRFLLYAEKCLDVIFFNLREHLIILCRRLRKFGMEMIVLPII